jgi:hypothetical protein
MLFLVSGPKEREMATQELITAANIAKELGASPAKVKKAIEGLGLQPAAKKGVCSYYGRGDVKKIQAALK